MVASIHTITFQSLPAFCSFLSWSRLCHLLPSLPVTRHVSVRFNPKPCVCCIFSPLLSRMCPLLYQNQGLHTRWSLPLSQQPPFPSCRPDLSQSRPAPATGSTPILQRCLSPARSPSRKPRVDQTALSPTNRAGPAPRASTGHVLLHLPR